MFGKRSEVEAVGFADHTRILGDGSMNDCEQKAIKVLIMPLMIDFFNGFKALYRNLFV
ncbi:hypothetical protein LCGC14_1994870 [marine sediment metagenome]|uniref:Uncharacterized protein n=1 Tax=marine sediment metagenome TaxID=412755 RepID=A0A0F9F4T2_9ZZZZ